MSDARESVDPQLDVDRFWRLDADLARAERHVRSWRQREQIQPRRPGGLSQRFDAPVEPSPRITSRKPDLSNESLVSLLACELMAITALLILLIIETQHSPNFAKFLGLACAGAAAIVAITLLRWFVRQRTAIHRRGLESTVKTSSDHRMDAASPPRASFYGRLLRETRPSRWD